MPARKITASDVMTRLMRSARVASGLTQETIAKRLKVTQGAVSRWESEFGTLSANQIIAYAAAVGESPERLFGVYCEERRKRA